MKRSFSGKELNRSLGNVFSFLSIMFYLIPSVIKTFMWNISSSFDGYFALGFRYILLKSILGENCGSNVYIGKNVILKNVDKLSIGNNVSIHANCYIDAVGGIDIGDDVSIAHNSSLISFDHTWSDKGMAIKYNPTVLGPIHIHSDVWVGCGVRILSNTTIQSRVVLAAGAVAKGDLLANSIYAGVPCKMIRDIS
jgi:acetyltransferase-like isoleucine patch superfamily enzyme